VIGSCREKKHTIFTGNYLGRSRACVKIAVKLQHCIPVHKDQMHFVSGIEASHFSSYGQKVTGS